MENKKNKKIKVITISGKAGSGKDFIAQLMKTALEKKNNNVLITHYADLLKYVCKTFFNWNGEKDEDGRTLLQHIGTDIVRNQNENFWVDSLVNIISMFPNKWDVILIPDVRFPNEIERLKTNDLFQVYSVKVIRENYDTKLTTEQMIHESETALNDYKFDYYIFNQSNISETTKSIIKVINHIYKIADTIYIDIDQTIINSIKAIVELYDEDYCYYTDYTKVPWQTVRTWELTELKLATKKELSLYFNQKRFFDKVDFFPNAINCINQLSKKYNIVFVSLGKTPNLKLKKEFINKYFPYAEFIGLNFNEYSDKSHIDMSNAIFIDDNSRLLYTSNAKYKIMFGEEFEWNEDWLFNSRRRRAYTWDEVAILINEFESKKGE